MSTVTLENDAAVTPAKKPQVIVAEGNEAAALAVAMARPDMVAVYPITPQSSLVEHVAKLIADGTMTDAEADAIVAEVKQEVDVAIQFGIDSPYPEPDDAFNGLFAGTSR